MNWLDTLSPEERMAEELRQAQSQALEAEFVADVLSECAELSTSSDIIVLSRENLKTLLNNCLILNSYSDPGESPADRVLQEVFK